MQICICPYLRLSAETETQFLRNRSRFQAACILKFLVNLKYHIYLHGSKLTMQAALWIFLFVRCRFDYSYRKRTDFALCGGRRGLCPSTPQAFPGKRLERNPLPLCLFVLSLLIDARPNGFPSYRIKGLLHYAATALYFILHCLHHRPYPWKTIWAMPEQNYRPVHTFCCHHTRPRELPAVRVYLFHQAHILLQASPRHNRTW